MRKSGLLDEAMVIGVTRKRESPMTTRVCLMDPKRPGEYRKMPILGDLHEVLLAKGRVQAACEYPEIGW